MPKMLFALLAVALLVGSSAARASDFEPAEGRYSGDDDDEANVTFRLRDGEISRLILRGKYGSRPGPDPFRLHGRHFLTTDFSFEMASDYQFSGRWTNRGVVEGRIVIKPRAFGNYVVLEFKSRLVRDED